MLGCTEGGAVLAPLFVCGKEMCFVVETPDRDPDEGRSNGAIPPLPEDIVIVPDGVQAELPFGHGEHCYIASPLVSYLTGDWQNESGPLPSLTIWFDPARLLWVGLFRSRSRRARAYQTGVNLPELLNSLAGALSRGTLQWRQDRG